MRKLVENDRVMRILVRGASKIFYNICELYAMQACGVLPILQAKLKALVHLDETGVRIFQNYTMKNLEDYWEKDLKEIFENNFRFEELKDIPRINEVK